MPYTDFYTRNGEFVGRLEGRLPAAAAPDGGDYVVQHVVTADDVRAEAARRIGIIVGARDAAHLQVLIANASREAIRLLRIKAERDWTAGEAQRAAELEAADAAIEAVRAASNALEVMDPVPGDYAEDAWWPA